MALLEWAFTKEGKQKHRTITFSANGWRARLPVSFFQVSLFSRFKQLRQIVLAQEKGPQEITPKRMTRNLTRAVLGLQKH